ncbi:hypothetical protein QN355_17015 [Cryobacterium sp. 10S3]|uniref:hypothetical protein n=1 Tax=unclassified Cryobacterium TaxID=2649013 RepID=UPI002AB42FB1|nr:MULTISPECIES: hypothetical protein [unclassified Cryobacterium]MDY7540816.1 hypothetical protein [Cryobacterium sp. 5B3]MEB0000214.1 hypothetical protein [Cryobacterium sp. RTS3]MEB0202753.1 hypothetical protein [Cryobacterium sp. 5I3]MEB0267934.1 hypothetical protein [Cryobacterium sp. 10I5]MEB0275771.1 hypothetical protein [Cryobacterium sp. 5B3]
MPSHRSRRGWTRTRIVQLAAVAAATGVVAAIVVLFVRPAGTQFPWHTHIISTTFWVGEVFDPTAADGSQVLSTYDSLWIQSFGGCDGVLGDGSCQTEQRRSANGFLPSQMAPKENPFYLDLPFDDVHDQTALSMRQKVIPWAGEPAYATPAGDPTASLMKNRWVRIRANGQTCYGQIEDAGPGSYHDASYVFGSNDQRPENRKFNGAGMDVSPALNGCLHFTDVNGETDTVDWQFLAASDVPAGPWTAIVTTSGTR